MLLGIFSPGNLILKADVCMFVLKAVKLFLFSHVSFPLYTVINISNFVGVIFYSVLAKG